MQDIGGKSMPPYLLFHPLVLSGLLRVEGEVASGEALLFAPPLELRNVVHGHAGLELLAIVETRLEACTAGLGLQRIT